MISPPASRSGASTFAPLTRYVRAQALLALEMASAGLAVWSVLYWRMLSHYLIHNDISPHRRLWLLGDMLVPAVLAWLISTVYIVRTHGLGLKRVEDIAARLAPLSVLGLVPMLLNLPAWAGRELSFLVLACVLALGLRHALLMAQQAPPLWADGSGPRAWLTRLPLPPVAPSMPAWIVGFGIAAYVTYFTAITLTNHWNLGTAGYDLGLEDNVVWNIVHGIGWFKSSPFCGPNCSHFGNHATFFSFLIGLVYRFVERAETLLVIQALFTGAAAWPLYLLARRKLTPWPAALIALCYLMNPALHGSILYDFHYPPLAPFFLWFTLLFALQQRLLLTILFTALTLSIREDAGILLGTLGFFLLLSGERPRTGLILGLLGMLWYLGLKTLFMPLFSNGYHVFVDMYKGLLVPGERNFFSVIKTVFGNPAFTLGHLLERDKLVYLLQLMTPLALLPLMRPMGLLFCFPGFLVTLLSTGYWPLYQISFQYTVNWNACLFIAVIAFLPAAVTADGMTDLSARRRQRAWIATLVVMTLIVSHQFGAVLQQDRVRAGFGQFRFGHSEQDARNYETVRGLIGQIPADAKVSASDPLVPHVSNRSDAYSLFGGYHDADYIFFCIPNRRDDERRWTREALGSGLFGVVAHRDGFGLAKRGHPTDLNGEVLPRL